MRVTLLREFAARLREESATAKDQRHSSMNCFGLDAEPSHVKAELAAH